MAKVQRRQFLIAAGTLLATPGIAQTKVQERLPVLGLLVSGSKRAMEPFLEKWLVNRLRELGWTEGKTILIERVYSEGDSDRLPVLATSLVANRVDVIWTNRTPGPVAAARATKSIPIVFWLAGYPIELGLIDSFAKPGRNVTGVAWVVDIDVQLKRFQLLRELVPGARRVALVVSPSTNSPTVAGGVFDFSTLRAKAETTFRDLGFEIRRFELTAAAGLDSVLAAIAKWAPEALFVQDFALTSQAGKRIVEFARNNRLIDFYEGIFWTQGGGLFSYGVVIVPTLLRTASMIDRILRGGKPADIPVELPTQYELAVNLATAKALGLTIPQSVLLRADRVIE